MKRRKKGKVIVRGTVRVVRDDMTEGGREGRL